MIKHHLYQLIQYLFTISGKKFKEEFEVNNEKDIDMVVKYFKQSIITNLYEVKMRANIAKHIECNDIMFNFSNNFRAEDIPDATVMTMLDNVENKI